MAKIPLWATAASIRRNHAELNAAFLRDAARQGLIRTSKTGATQQAARLYHVQDVLDMLDKLSRGEIPRKRRRPSKPPKDSAG